MPTFQTTAAVAPRSVISGSGKVEVSATSSFTTSDGNFTSLGLVTGIQFTENISQSEIQADNGEAIRPAVGDHGATLAFNMLEFYPPTLNLMRGGIDTLTSTTSPRETYFLQVGGKSKIASRCWRITNKILADDGATFLNRQLYIRSGTIASGLDMAFQDDKADDPGLKAPVTIDCRLDTSVDTSEGQLYWFVDEYSISTA